MSLYELERKINDKADKYELHDLRQQNRQLVNDISDLNRQINELKSANNNRYYALDGLFSLLAEHPMLSEISDQIQELRRSI